MPVFYGCIVVSILSVIAGLNPEGNPARVIAFCPIIPGDDRFDPNPSKAMPTSSVWTTPSYR